MGQAKGRIAGIAGFCFLLVLILLVTAMTVYNIAGDRWFLAAEMGLYSEPKYSGLPEEQYPEMGRMIAEYLTGRTDEFQYTYKDENKNIVTCFSPHEADHMADCRELIALAGRLRWLLGFAALALLITGIALRRWRKNFASGMLAGFGAAAAVCLGLTVWGLADFDGLFTAFHHLVFNNDGWLLDPRTDMLIRLMPTDFFVSMGVRVVLAVAAAALAGFTAAMIIRKTNHEL